MTSEAPPAEWPPPVSFTPNKLGEETDPETAPALFRERQQPGSAEVVPALQPCSSRWRHGRSEAAAARLVQRPFEEYFHSFSQHFRGCRPERDLTSSDWRCSGYYRCNRSILPPWHFLQLSPQ